MKATVERRAGDLTFLVAYTFSKSLDDASSSGAYLDFYNFKLQEALGGQGTAAPRFFHGPGQENFDL